MLREMAEILDSKDDLKVSDGSQVCVRGVYEQLNVSAHPKRKVFNGRGRVILDDGTTFLLETGDAGLRSKEEIQRFEHKKVRASGTLRRSVNAWGDGCESSIVGDAIVDNLTLQLDE